MKKQTLAVRLVSSVLLALMLAGLPAGAATILKADNTNALGLATSWVGDLAPTSADVANWSGPYSASPNAPAGLTNSLRAVNSGTAISWQGISVGTLSGTALTTNTIYWGTGTPAFGAETNLSAASQSGSIVTITTKANHGYAPGQQVTVAGVTPSGYNGTFTVLGVPSATTFTYSTAPGLTAGTAFGTVEGAIYVGGAGTSVANSSYTIGNSGIDLSAASHSLALCATGFAFNGNQTWAVAAGRDIRFGGSGVSAASAKAVTSGNDGLIDITGSGVVDANQGGGTGMADVGGFTGFTGKWRVNSGATLRGLRNGATAWGSNPGADSITLNGGTLAVGGISGAVGNWTWTNAITLAAGTTSAIDEQNVAGTGRYLKLNGPISGSGNLVFKESLVGATTFTSADAGFILAGPNTMSGTVTIGGPLENGVANRLTYVRVGGVGGDSTANGIGPDGSLGTATIVNNGVLTFSLNTGISVGIIHGTGSLRVGYTTTAGAEGQVVTLNGANDYSGNTTVNIGTLSLAAGASIPNTPNIFLTPFTSASGIAATLQVTDPNGLVLNNGQRLVGGPNNAGGNNFAQVIGNVTAGTGSAIVPGGTNVANALTIAGNLTLTGGATLVFDVSSTASDLLTAQDVSPSGVTTLLINPPGGGLTGGTYTLITANGILGGSAANFALAGLASSGRGQTFTVIYEGGSVKLQVVGSPAVLAWRGDGTANVWDNGVTTNWLNAGLPDAFFSGDTVTFDDNGSRTPPVNLTGAVQPGSITVSAAGNYTFAGTGQLIGIGPLTNVGPGTLTLLTSNAFAGKVAITGGAVAITNETALGVNPASFVADQLFLDNGTLSLGAALSLRHPNRGITLGADGGTISHGTFAVTVSNIVTGAGALTKTGTGTLTLSGSNSYTGGTIIADGLVTYGNGAGLGRGASTSGTSGFFAKPFTLQKGTVDLNGKTSYEPNFAGGTAALGVPVMLYDGPVVFAGTAGATMAFQDTSGTLTNGWGNGNANANTVTYDATANPGTATIAARFAASGSSGATVRTFEIGDSTATVTEVNITAPMGVISVNATNQDGRNTTIVKSGEGTLQISASNNFPVIQVNAGTLRVNHLQALGADRTISTGVSPGTTGLPNTLTVAGGVVDLNGFSPAIGGLNDGGLPLGIVRNNGGTISTLTVGLSWTNSVSSSYMGVLENGTGGLALAKVGSGTLVLGGVNTYTGGTTVGNGILEVDGSIASGAAVRAGGTLSGFGTVSGVVTVDPGGTLAPGTTNIGTLNLSASPVLNGAVLCKLDRNAGSPLADKLVVTGNPIAYQGLLVLTNTGAPLVVGDKFTLFAASGYSGAFTLVSQTPGQLIAWNTASLASDGSVTVAGILPSEPPPMTNVVSGGNYEISWPAEYLGFQLQVQTNSLAVGLSNNWTGWPGSTATNRVFVPIVPANPSVFLRLAYPPL